MRVPSAVLDAQVRIFGNPYSHMIPDEEFFDLVVDVVAARANDIAERAKSGEYPRDSMGFIVLDRTAPYWKPSDECVLIVAIIGPEGEDFIPNAMAKTIQHRDKAVDCGVLVYTQKGRLSEGDFRYGFSVCIDGTYVGGSAQSELQDRYQATVLAADLNYRVDSAITAWEVKTGKSRWYCNEDLPGERYAHVFELRSMRLIEIVKREVV